MFFSGPQEALEYLNKSSEQPFIILSDINLPWKGEIDLRKELRSSDNLGIKCLPFIFYTCTPSDKITMGVYSDGVQGFFVKSFKIEDGARVLGNIFNYWKDAYYPA